MAVTGRANASKAIGLLKLIRLVGKGFEKMALIGQFKPKTDGFVPSLVKLAIISQLRIEDHRFQNYLIPKPETEKTGL
jgi:hypothetical protein